MMRDTAECYGTASEEFNDMVNKVIRSINSLRSEWEGKSKDVIFEYFEADCKELKAFPVMLKKISSELYSCADKYEEQDKSLSLAANKAVSIKQSIIAPLAANSSYPTIRQGSSGEYVKKVQEELKELGYYQGATNGEFDEKTEAAVRAYQVANNLAKDGIVGVHTCGKLLGQNVNIHSSTEKLVTKGDGKSGDLNKDGVSKKFVMTKVGNRDNEKKDLTKGTSKADNNKTDADKLVDAAFKEYNNGKLILGVTQERILVDKNGKPILDNGNKQGDSKTKYGEWYKYNGESLNGVQIPFLSC